MIYIKYSDLNPYKNPNELFNTKKKKEKKDCFVLKKKYAQR